MKIYVIGGKAKTGKNTFGEYLREELKNYGYKPCVMHITSPLYSYARNYFEWDGNENSKPREFLQKMGIEIIQQKLGKKDFLLNRLYEDIDILKEFFDVFIITDARLCHEFDSLKEKYDDVVTIKLERENYYDYLSPDERKHITETELDQYKNFDYTIQNVDLSDLKVNAIQIVRKEESNRGDFHA